MSYQLGNNYIPMEKMFLHADDIEDNRRSAETYLKKALGMGVYSSKNFSYGIKTLRFIFSLGFFQPLAISEEYKSMTPGDVLGDILEDCSKSTPDDPILFVADSLER